MYIIHWKSKLTGKTGYGTRPCTKLQGDAWMALANKQGLDWLVPVS